MTHNIRLLDLIAQHPSLGEARGFVFFGSHCKAPPWDHTTYCTIRFTRAPVTRNKHLKRELAILAEKLLGEQKGDQPLVHGYFMLSGDESKVFWTSKEIVDTMLDKFPKL